MKTIFDEPVRRELLTRVEKLSPSSPRQWGEMTPDQMIAHVNAGISANIGDFTPAGKHKPLQAAILRLFTFSKLPIPKARALTLPELDMKGKSFDIEKEKAKFKTLTDRMGAARTKESWPVSVIFGKLSRDQYGKLVYKHVDHHLRQFGL